MLTNNWQTDGQKGFLFGAKSCNLGVFLENYGVNQIFGYANSSVKTSSGSLGDLLPPFVLKTFCAHTGI